MQLKSHNTFVQAINIFVIFFFPSCSILAQIIWGFSRKSSTGCLVEQKIWAISLDQPLTFMNERFRVSSLEQCTRLGIKWWYQKVLIFVKKFASLHFDFLWHFLSCSYWAFSKIYAKEKKEVFRFSFFTKSDRVGCRVDNF